MGCSDNNTTEIKITEKQIVDYIKKAKLLPEQFVFNFFDKKMLKTKEIKHYLKEAI